LDLNHQDERGWTPLILAAQNGCTSIVKHLLDAGVAVDAPDHAGRCALHWAAERGHADVVTMLINTMVERQMEVHLPVSVSSKRI
jgi:uncharacterized protein